MATPSWENVLILQTSFLGDTVLTLPLISEIRRRFAVRKLTLLCQPVSRELLQDHPAIDEIIVDDKKRADRGLVGLRRKAAVLASRRFTIALTPHKSLRSALMLCWADIPKRVGFRQSRGWFLFHHRVNRDSARHDVERNLSILEAFGVHPEQCRREIDLPVSPAVQSAVDQKLITLGVDHSKPIVGINPGSVWPTKRWSAAGFARLIQLLRQRFDCQVMIFGGADDANVVAEVRDRCAGAAISLVGEISMRELPAAIRRCRVFVTNDSGPMHIAVAEKISTVAVFCATTPDLGFYPYSHDAVVVEKTLPCRPCASHGGRRCPLGHEACIRLVQPETMLQAVEKLLPTTFRGPNSPVASFRPQFLAV
ncbi:MAG TPA: lipopolysaccharide heptosyltransferase II [Acidobacteriota bacterium]|nr:lipopolysaccharide heptosyltransferase II [Acidobacteriota bacterium]